MFQEQQIKIRRASIFNYVLGNTLLHPIEDALGGNKSNDLSDAKKEYFKNRYEVFDKFIFDYEKNIKVIQSKNYTSFMGEVAELLAIVQHYPKITKKEIYRICEELVELSPKFVLLP